MITPEQIEAYAALHPRYVGKHRAPRARRPFVLALLAVFR